MVLYILGIVYPNGYLYLDAFLSQHVMFETIYAEARKHEIFTHHEGVPRPIEDIIADLDAHELVVKIQIVQLPWSGVLDNIKRRLV